MKTMDPTTRFSNRVENYIRYRPRYPEEVIRILEKEFGLTDESVIADIGSGTGISSELFLHNGNVVFAVEPNAEMRHAAERQFGSDPRFFSIAGTAEESTLEPASVHFVVAGQAFHWFDQQKEREEFARILKPEGRVVLIWNDRQIDSTPFLQEYEQLLKRYGTDYQQVDHKRIDANVLATFFAGGEYVERTVPNEQLFQYDGLEGRLFSSSYTPSEGEPGYQPMKTTLRQIFERYNENGFIRFVYDTRVFVGQVSSFRERA
jgi:SAM-dependent methyltransferase